MFSWPKKTLSGTEKVLNQKSQKQPKCFSSCSPQTGHLNSTWTPHGSLHTKQQHFVWSSAQLHHFFTTSKSRKALVVTPSKPTASSLGCHFLYLWVCMHTWRSPSNNPKLITQDRSQDRWIRNTVDVCTWAWDQRTGVWLYWQSNKPLEKTEVGP